MQAVVKVVADVVKVTLETSTMLCSDVVKIIPDVVKVITGTSLEKNQGECSRLDIVKHVGTKISTMKPSWSTVARSWSGLVRCDAWMW